MPPTMIFIVRGYPLFENSYLTKTYRWSSGDVNCKKGGNSFVAVLPLCRRNLILVLFLYFCVYMRKSLSLWQTQVLILKKSGGHIVVLVNFGHKYSFSPSLLSDIVNFMINLLTALFYVYSKTISLLAQCYIISL